MSSSVRKSAQRLARPAVRYWKGKAPKGVAEVESDSEPEDITLHLEGDIPLGEDLEDDDLKALGIRKEIPSAKAINIALKDVSVSKEGKVMVAGREESGRTIFEEVFDEEGNEEEEEEPELEVPGQESEEESSEYGSDSEEEKLEFRPVFVPKRARVTIAEKEAIAQDTEEALRRKEIEAEERRKQSHDLVAESIRRELAEKEKEENIPDVDDTDGLDPAGEFEAWRLRELGRIKKEKEEEIAREKEWEEIERRRAMPEEQRLKEDLERAKQSREAKPKGQQKFLQKYWHKGAFHQDEEILRRRDYTEATESTVDVSLLPKVMQVKNFGKRSRTKYTHLLDQDTTVGTRDFSGVAPVKTVGTGLEGGCFLCGGPHLKRDCPQNGEFGRPTGSNSASLLGQKPDTTTGGRDSSFRDERDRDGGGRRYDWNAQDHRQDGDGFNKLREFKNSSRPPRNNVFPRRRSHERAPEEDTRGKRRRME